MSVLHKFFQKIEERILPHSLDEFHITLRPKWDKDIIRKEIIPRENRKILIIILANRIQEYIKNNTLWISVVYPRSTRFI